MLDQAHFIGAPNTRGEFPVLNSEHEFLFNVDLDTAVLLTKTRDIIDKTSLVDLCPPELRLHPQLSIKEMVQTFYTKMTQQNPIRGRYAHNVIYSSEFAYFAEHKDEDVPIGGGGPNKTLPKKLRPNLPWYSGPSQVSMNIIKARDHRKTV